MISTVPDPNNFANFTDSQGNYQMVVNYFETSGEGEFCAPINISAAGIDGIQDGANVTLQFIYSGGDGNLYQVRSAASRLDAVARTHLCSWRGCSART